VFFFHHICGLSGLTARSAEAANMTEKKQNGCVVLAVTFAFLLFALSSPRLVLPVCGSAACLFVPVVLRLAVEVAVRGLLLCLRTWLYLKFNLGPKPDRCPYREFVAYSKDTRN
jgi:hypothetical protein